ncbi:MAG: cytochrome c oxidase cbb3-type subunit I/II [Kiritimatiellia bacterium]|jgi:cytochrome c oxidase cbb3-type subunit I/II
MNNNNKTEHWHRRLVEKSGVVMAVITVVLILVGTVVEIVPLLLTAPTAEQQARIQPYSALEQAGRDIYVREGCYTCHSQHVRPFRSETLRYGIWSASEEYIHDRPFQLGSRRAGPDLHRIGKKYPDSWHYRHMDDPRATSPGSVMPRFSWLHTSKVDPADIQASLGALQWAGTPYTDEDIADVEASMKAQGSVIVTNLAKAKIKAAHDDEIVALIAYLQSLGRHQRRPPTEASK